MKTQENSDIEETIKRKWRQLFWDVRKEGLPDSFGETETTLLRMVHQLGFYEGYAKRMEETGDDPLGAWMSKVEKIRQRGMPDA